MAQNQSTTDTVGGEQQGIQQAIRSAYGWACARLYHEFAWTYDSVSRLVSFGQWDAWRLAALPMVQGARVLELGFGTGVLLEHLVKRGYAVAGVDASPDMLRIAQRRLHKKGFEAVLVLARGQALPFPDQSFDTIIATFPAPYILAPATLRECRRVLQRLPQACLVVVGLWVAPKRSHVRSLAPVFYAEPSTQWIQAVQTTLAEQGLAATVFAQPIGWAEVGIIHARHDATP